MSIFGKVVIYDYRPMYTRSAQCVIEVIDDTYKTVTKTTADIPIEHIFRLFEMHKYDAYERDIDAPNWFVDIKEAISKTLETTGLKVEDVQSYLCSVKQNSETNYILKVFLEELINNFAKD